MVLRRHRGILQVVVALVVVGGLMRYMYKYYRDNSMKLKAANIRRHELLEERNKLNRELEAATESKSNLEFALKSKTVELSKFKKECQNAKEEFENQANKEKSESMTKFNALDSEYRMLKASKDDLEIEHKHLKRNFERLNEDHKTIQSQYKKNIEEIKAKDEKIMTALQKQVEHFQNQENNLEMKVKELEQSLAKYQNTIDELRQQQLKDESHKPRNKRVSDDAEKPLHESLHIKTRKKKSAKGSEREIETIKRRKVVADEKGDTLNVSHEKRHRKFLNDVAKQSEEALNKETVVEKNVVIAPRVAKDKEEVEEGKIYQDKLREKERGNHIKQEDFKKNSEDELNDSEDQNDESRRKIGGEKEIEDKRKIEDEEKTVDERKNKDEIKVDIKENPKMDKDKKQELIEKDKKENGGNEELNNDQKFDDRAAVLQEGEENDDNAGEGQENKELENENLLLENNGQQDRDT